ncbi:hypothetical protein ACFQE4_25260 [Streptomyces thermocoprophilus]|uniref:hypothetical protein n=1 Tax=Streptomyces thermocoprophilus TaxID=78356 RepID=UPI00361860AF
MASNHLTVPAPAPEPGRPAPGRPTPDATSNATRLLCAGTYLDPVYRTAVIRELLTHRFRVVAPSYGYDAVPVLGHALAARRLHRMRLAALAAGAALILVLTVAGALGGFTAFLLVLWLLWATAFFRRVVTLQVLVRRLRPRSDGRFDGAYPEHPDLTRELVHKINRQQTADGTIIRYGGYKPFVGAGVPVRNWSNAQLLVGAPESPFEAGRPAPAVPGAVGRELRRKQVVPFTAEEMTARIAERMQQVLRDQTAADQRIDGLTVERSTFTTAVTTVRDVGRDPTPEDLDRPFVDDPTSPAVSICASGSAPGTRSWSPPRSSASTSRATPCTPSSTRTSSPPSRRASAWWTGCPSASTASCC